MRRLRLAAALVTCIALHVWHACCRFTGADPPDDRPPTIADSAVVEHERGWYDYLRGFHAHHGDPESYGVPATDGDSPEHGILWHGLDAWWQSNCLRGYTLGDHVYLCPGAPRVVRIHQAGHAPSLGSQFPTLVDERRADGGLPDEPLRTLDVMLPGRFPHTLCRVRDSRGLGETYDEWLGEGRIRRLSG